MGEQPNTGFIGAFPFHGGDRKYYDSDGGMSLRDWFAGKALLVASQDNTGTVASAAAELGIESKEYDPQVHWYILVAKQAYKYADAMMANRELISEKKGES